MVAKSNLTPFLRKLLAILDNQEYQNIISWDPTKIYIDIFDDQKFSNQILPLYFRHNKLESFLRQLNLYGFRKIKKASCHRFGHPQLKKQKDFFSVMEHKSQSKYSLKSEKKELEEASESLKPVPTKQPTVASNYIPMYYMPVGNSYVDGRWGENIWYMMPMGSLQQ